MASKDPDRPNIVSILSDDQGAWALGCAGNPDIRTPNLDRLAESGVRFSNFFCTSPVCSPARASLLTGLLPSQHGVQDYLSAGNFGPDAIEYLEGRVGYTDLLAAQGYDCAISGKWHLGDSQHPQKSFSHWFVHQKGGSRYQNAPMVRDGVPTIASGYLTDAITDDALTVIDESAQSDRPFYLSVHYTAPHSPWVGEHPESIVASYDNCAFTSCPQEPIHPWALKTPLLTAVRADPREHLKGYFAAITAMDLNIGRILDRLDRANLRTSTLVCFVSDNGFNCGHHGIWGKGNGTFPLNMYDTSVRVPAIFSQPGRISAHRVSSDLVSGYDFMPTLLEYVGNRQPLPPHLPGQSFCGVLLQREPGHRQHVVVFDEYGPVRMIRTQEWKYIHRYPYGPHELYDLVRDADECDNLLDQEPPPAKLADVVASLRSQLDTWFLQYVDPALDGSRQPVTGMGQLGPVGAKSQGKPVFRSNPPRWFP